MTQLPDGPVTLSAEASRELAREWGLTDGEYDLILEKIGRQPTVTEIAMFSVEWCEHCGYPKSRKWLSLFPKESTKAESLVGADCGGFYLTPDVAVVMKVESHNHPSQVEPYQGAATGVGGILRDIFTTGARPIASGNSLRFGELSDPYTRYLVHGVVGGIGGYGNCMGVPTVCGETFFHRSFNGNCLVNALSVGVAPRRRLVSGAAAGPGNPVIYVGSRTGRDGIGGCSVLASAVFGEGEEKRPTVQIGDPFAEKRLLEACLEAIDTGRIVGMKDMGAAGVTCTTSEMAAAGGVGMRVELQKIPRRESGMEPWEVLMSESQERMLLVAGRGHEDEVIRVFEKWGQNAVAIGEVTGDGLLTVLDGGEVVAEVPAETLASAPKYDMPATEPAYLKETRAFDASTVPEPEDYGEALLRLIGSPNLCSRRWIWEQYDSTVQTNTIAGPGGDAAILRVKEAAPRGLALTMDGNSRYCFLDPYEGARLAVAEAARNVSCVGAEPVIVTDGLNFGSPDEPDRFWQFRECVRGLADACREFDLAVVSGNVSFYNESPAGPIYPTPIVGVLGVLPDVARHATPAFKRDGDMVLLIGAPEARLDSSEYLSVIHGIEAGTPAPLDVEKEKAVQSLVRGLIAEGTVDTAHDIADGGLAIALAEMAIHGERGVTVDLPETDARWDVRLFGEAPSRVLVAVPPERAAEVSRRAGKAGVPIMEIGKTGGARFTFKVTIDMELAPLRDAWERGLPERLRALAH